MGFLQHFTPHLEPQCSVPCYVYTFQIIRIIGYIDIIPYFFQWTFILLSWIQSTEIIFSCQAVPFVFRFLTAFLYYILIYTHQLAHQRIYFPSTPVML